MPEPLPVLFLPDALCTGEQFAPQIEAFGAARRIVVADVSVANSITGLAEHVLAGAPARFALCAASLGATVALEIMRRSPARVERLALVSARPGLDRPGEKEGRLRVAALARARGIRDVTCTLLPRLVHLSRLADNALVDIVFRMAEEIGVEGFGRQMEAANSKTDSRPVLATITCPTAVIVGDSEVMIPLGAAQDIACGIAGAGLHVIPRCGHLPTLERPDLVNEILLDWLEA